MAVYLIHFEERYKHAGHYIGYSSDLNGRIRAHRENRGARLLEVVNQVGINWDVVRIWTDGDYELERQLKAQRNGPRFCPKCNPRVADYAVEKQQCVIGIAEMGGLDLLEVGGFYLWLLSQPEGMIVGRPDERASGPLERWLCVLYGGQWEVSAGWYRWRAWDWLAWSEWQTLPPWAIAFLDKLYQSYGNAPVSREQVLEVLNESLADLALWQGLAH